jgi:hypothetical protein
LETSCLAVIEVREVELFVVRPNLHFFQRIAQVGIAQLIEPDRLRIVRRDCHESDPFVLIVGGQLLDPLLIRLGRRAVIAGEDNDEHLRLVIVGQPVHLSVHAGKAEIGRFGPDFQGLDLRSRRDDRSNEQAGGNCKYGSATQSGHDSLLPNRFGFDA